MSRRRSLLARKRSTIGQEIVKQKRWDAKQDHKAILEDPNKEPLWCVNCERAYSSSDAVAMGGKCCGRRLWLYKDRNYKKK